MKWKGLHLHVIAAVFIVVVAVIFGVQHLVDSYEVRGPLVAAAKRVPGVKSAELTNDAKGTNLVVRLGSTPDFRATYAALEKLLSRQLGTGAGAVVVEDSRSPSLQASYDQLQFVIQEGIATGRFEAMRTAFAQESAVLGLKKSQLYIDSGHVYVAMENDAHYLYEVVARPGQQTGVETTAVSAGAEGGAANA